MVVGVWGVRQGPSVSGRATPDRAGVTGGRNQTVIPEKSGIQKAENPSECDERKPAKFGPTELKSAGKPWIPAPDRAEGVILSWE